VTTIYFDKVWFKCVALSFVLFFTSKVIEVNIIRCAYHLSKVYILDFVYVYQVRHVSQHDQTAVQRGLTNRTNKKIISVGRHRWHATWLMKMGTDQFIVRDNWNRLDCRLSWIFLDINVALYSFERYIIWILTLSWLTNEPHYEISSWMIGVLIVDLIVLLVWMTTYLDASSELPAKKKPRVRLAIR
jgi:hypothetical protein